DGLLVAGDAAAMCLAAGIWLEGVNFAMASGMYAAQAAHDALARNDVSARGLGSYTDRLNATFVLRDHKKLRKIPGLVLSDRVQQKYPGFVTGVVDRVFRVDNPSPKPGLRRIVREERKKAGIRLVDLLKDGWTGMRGFG
ncbi:MAG: electron transfer flavoprotein, partial [Ilumatobacteraceae bacterium]